MRWSLRPGGHEANGAVSDVSFPSRSNRPCSIAIRQCPDSAAVGIGVSCSAFISRRISRGPSCRGFVLLHFLERHLAPQGVPLLALQRRRRAGRSLDHDVVPVDDPLGQVAVEHDASPLGRILGMLRGEVLRLRVPDVVLAVEVLLAAVDLAAIHPRLLQSAGGVALVDRPLLALVLRGHLVVALDEHLGARAVERQRHWKRYVAPSRTGTGGCSTSPLRSRRRPWGS